MNGSKLTAERNNANYEYQIQSIQKSAFSASAALSQGSGQAVAGLSSSSSGGSSSSGHDSHSYGHDFDEHNAHVSLHAFFL